MNLMERGFSRSPVKLVYAALLLLSVGSVTYGNKCLDGTCHGSDISCLATLNETCDVQANGGCETNIYSNGTVYTTCVKACPVTTPATTIKSTTGAQAIDTTTTTTKDVTTEQTTATATLSGRKRRATTTVTSTSCCLEDMCNVFKPSAKSQKSSALQINISLVMLAGVILLVGAF